MRTTFILIFLVVAAIVFLITRGSRPSDQEMINLFNNHYSEFSQLRDLCYQDEEPSQLKNSATKSAVIKPRSGRSTVSHERQREYQTIFRKIGPVTSVRCFDEEVEVFAYSSGLSISGWRKFYVYKPSNLSNTRVMKSLDNVEEIWRDQPSLVVALREIRDGWYLIYVGN